MNDYNPIDSFNEHDTVKYVPAHANQNINHCDVEDGIVTSKNDTYVFVKFVGQSNSKACSPNNLYIITQNK